MDLWFSLSRESDNELYYRRFYFTLDEEDFYSYSTVAIGRLIVAARSTDSAREAEYVAISTASRETIWLKELGKGLSLNMDWPVVIHGVNKTSSKIVQKGRGTKSSEHIAIYLDFL